MKSAELRGHLEEIELTKEQMDEYVKCSRDIFYFSKYFYILTDESEAPIHLREYQERIIRCIVGKYYDKEGVIRNNRICMMGRQAGKTTIATLYILWYALFNGDKTIAVLANKEDQAKEIMLRIRSAILKLPLWLQQGINPDRGGWSKESIGFDNGTKIFCAASGSSAIRGKSDPLLGLKENVLIGKLVPAGTGMSVFRKVDVVPSYFAAENSDEILNLEQLQELLTNTMQ